jgi:predicted DNA-binding transcriptional regulator YafY
LKPERIPRLYALVRLLARGPQTREALVRRLRLEVRGFYRDLRLLRKIGVEVTLNSGRYVLEDDTTSALARLPFPDPGLTFAEAEQLARGRTVAHKKIKTLIDKMTKG